MAKNEDERKFQRPVAWLGGRELLANLKSFALFAAYKGKLDPRDWMNAELYPSPSSLPDVTPRFNPVNAFWTAEDGGEFWFDYFADSGDGMTAVYNLAYLCLSNLYVSGPKDWAALSDDERKYLIKRGEVLADLKAILEEGGDKKKIRKILRNRDLPDDLRTLLKQGNLQDAIELINEQDGFVTPVLHRPLTDAWSGQVLPRGAFLFVGGDTTYHVADYSSLAERFQAPFQWAVEDIPGNENGEKHEDFEGVNRRPIFGIPGNHDYYDEIDGFNRQFRAPITKEDDFIDLHGRNLTPLLSIPGFQRCQQSSYIAIRLPFDWWFWGLDSELDRLDMRQQEYFKNAYLNTLSESERKRIHEEKKDLPNDKRPLPKKLIIATSAPTTVSGERAGLDDKTSRTFSDLNLTRPFLFRDLKRSSLSRKERAKYEKCRKDEADLEEGEFTCRLDISGDIHHYARYWGKEKENQDGTRTADNYASIVSGGGGASLSPTQTRLGDIPAQAVYPSEDKSSFVVNRQLFNFLRVWKGGNVYLAGIIISIIIYLGATIPREHYHLTSSILHSIISPVEHTPLGRLSTFHHHEDFNLSSLFYLRHPLKLAALLLLSALAVGSSIVYARFLFLRLTKTYDWAFNNYRNRPTTESEEERQKLEEERPEYKKLVDEIVKQKPEGIRLESRYPFWIISALGLFLLLFFSCLVTYYYSLHGIFASEDFFFTGGTSHNWYLLLLIIYGLLVLFYFVAAPRFSYLRYRQLLTITSDESKDEVEKIDPIRQLVVTPYQDYIPFWMLLLIGLFGLTFTLFEYRMFPSQSQFGTSLCLLASLFIIVAAVTGSIYYSKWLFEQSYRISVVGFSYWPVRVLAMLAAGCLVASVWTFGAVRARYLISNLAFTLAILTVALGCLALAIFVGRQTRGLKSWFGFAVLGLWHGFLQLSVPFLLVWLGSQTSWLLVFGIIAVMTIVRGQLAKLTVARRSRLRVLLVCIWFIYGLLLILLPIVLNKGYIHPTPAPLLLEASLELVPFHKISFIKPLATDINQFTYGQKIASYVLAGIFGAVMSCVWLGWYFAISLLFNGHSNEAGSTALVEDYKQFIRFRLTEDSLTGYVIGIDKVQKNVKKLSPRLVDVIHLKCVPGGKKPPG